MPNIDPPGASPLPPVPLLITESDEEFMRIRRGLYEETKPVGIIECMYVDEMADLIWQIWRLKRCKVGVTNLAFHAASASILGRLMGAGPDVARDWISDPKIAKKVETELATYKLDGSVIIAEAIRKSTYELEAIETLLASSETRRDKALIRIAQYRGELGAMLRKNNDQLIESKVVELPRAAIKKKMRRRERADSKVVELDSPANTKKELGGLNVAGERQNAANRRNAQKSTGPRSVEGKKRASRNAYRHGLAADVWHSRKSAAQIDALASEIAAAATGSVVAAADAEILAFARTAAQAELDLARIRGMKTVAMSLLMAAASLQVAAVSHDTEMDLVAISPSGQPLFERAPTPVTSLPLSRSTGHADALRRSLMELSILDRYEQRAAARRDRAVLHIIARHMFVIVVKN